MGNNSSRPRPESVTERRAREHRELVERDRQWQAHLARERRHAQLQEDARIEQDRKDQRARDDAERIARINSRSGFANTTNTEQNTTSNIIFYIISILIIMLIVYAMREKQIK
jgi:hypothetical protein